MVFPRQVKGNDSRRCQLENFLRLFYRHKTFLCVLVFAICRTLMYLSQDFRDMAGDSMPLLLPTTVHQIDDQSVALQSFASNTSSIPVFYNVFVENEEEAPRVAALVEEQLSFRKPHHNPIYVHSIGYNLSIPDTILLQHHEKASEMVTLQSLWEYCHDHPAERVVYIHSKGSFHDTEVNERFRRFLTFGAFSDECAAVPMSICNVCSSRFSPLPHPHTPGNMFLAHCAYVLKLKQPRYFERIMQFTKKKGDPVCTGRLRYAAEHYIHSHFSVKPCDLYPNSSYTYNYENIPDILVPTSLSDGVNDQKSVPFGPLATSPRFDLATFSTIDICRGLGEGTLQDRLDEYEIIYKSLPDESWWGWDFWGVNYTKPAIALKIPSWLCHGKTKRNANSKELYKTDLATVHDCVRKLS